MSLFLFFTDLVDKRIVDPTGHEIVGRLADLIVPLGEPYPKVSALVLRRRRFGPPARLPIEAICDITAPTLVLSNGGVDALKPLEVASREVLLRGEILDHQIVDTFGCKVVRVNDIHFVTANGELRMAHVDIGFRGLMRRMGWERIMDKATQWLFEHKISDRFISWKYVQPLSAASPGQPLKLNVGQKDLSRLHPADLAEIIEDLSVYERSSLLRTLDNESAAEALSETEPEKQVAMIEAIGPKRAAALLEEMPPDRAVDLLQDLPDDRVHALLRALTTDKRIELTNLLRHHEKTVGGLMATDYLACPPATAAEEAIRHLQGHAEEVDFCHYVYVLAEDGCLLGVVSLRDLLTAQPRQPLSEIMTTRVVTVRPRQWHTTALDLFLKYGFDALPVVQHRKGGKMLGIVTFHDAVKAGAMPARRR